VRILRPSEASKADSHRLLEGEAKEDISVSDEEFIGYFDAFMVRYREVIERYFPTIGQFLTLYAKYPFETIVIRSGPSGVICLRKPAPVASFTFLKWGDWPAGVQTIFEIQEYFDAPFLSFDFQSKSYQRVRGEMDGARTALTDALDVFWHFLDENQFAAICEELLKAEGIEIQRETAPKSPIPNVDALGTLLIPEPGGYRREEKWGFRFHSQHSTRVSTDTIREAEDAVGSDTDVDVICILTSSDLTTIGKYVSVRSDRVRVWDRFVLNTLINRHLDSFSTYFEKYPLAVQALSEEFGNRESPHYEELRLELERCPSGQAQFARYEEICTRLISYVFSHTLGPPYRQPVTSDRVHRRDVVFRNLQGSDFFRRIAQRFDADFLIVDFKNYSKAIDSSVVESVSKYANKALGRFILLVARKGMAPSAGKALLRLHRDENTVIITVSDAQLLEMVARKDKGEDPDALLEDLLNEFLLQF
jgi:hypothetical protein